MNSSLGIAIFPDPNAPKDHSVLFATINPEFFEEPVKSDQMKCAATWATLLEAAPRCLFPAEGQDQVLLSDSTRPVFLLKSDDLDRLASRSYVVGSWLIGLSLLLSAGLYLCAVFTQNRRETL